MVKFTDADAAAAVSLESAALAEAPELLRSAFRALASQIRSCDESHPKWPPRAGGKVAAAELESLKTSTLHLWFASAGADNALARQARDVAYLVQDLQDRIEYRRLQSALAPRTKIFSRNRFNRLPALRCPWNRSGTDRAMRDIRAASKETRRLGYLLDKAQCQSSDPPPHSVRKNHQTAVAVFGRDKERDDIVSLLVQPCGGEVAAAAAPAMIVSVTGAGGIGKTTLAQMVFNDATVGRHFDARSWVSVSSTCSNKMELAAEILRSAQPAWDDGSHDEKTTVDFQMLQSELRRFVASKRCLIVLDDVCESTGEILLDLLTPLQSADIRSRILVTTRMPHHILGASKLYTVNPLGSGDGWSLLKEHALPSDAEDVHPDLPLIGRKIAAKINGSPLSLKLVGGVLGATTRSKAQWMNILETGLQDDTALLLSYKHLPGHLKRCFAYCSLFPQGYRFDPAHLSRIWIAEGFVQAQGRADRRMEDIAREYFDQLLSRSFFLEIKLVGQKMYYVVHDLLHDLAKSVAAEDCFRIEDGTSCDIPSTVRHLSLTMNSLPGLANFSGLDNLRTLLIQRSVPSSSCFQEDFSVSLKCLLQKSKQLRVLDLSGLNLEELPQCIDGLLGLRYLSIHGSIQRLPESIGKLLHLQTLCFTGKCSLDKLPASISMLVNLRHLVIETKYTAGLVGIGRLANLQGSLELHVEKKEGLKVEELRDINGLRGLLKIKGLENVSSYEEACKAELNKKPYLQSLNLEWSSAGRNNPLPADAKVLEGLQPHQDIKVLHIRRYCGAKAPSWLQSLHQLHSLHLTNCRSLAMLPALGQLGSLKYLHMKEMCAVDRIGNEFYGTGDVAFPSLSFLEVDDFPRLHEWSGIADRESFPCLERLIIMDCPELVKIPTFFPATREVTVERTRLIPYMRLAPFSSISEKFQLDLFTSSVDFNGLLSKQHIEAIAALNISGAEEVIATEEIGSFVSLKRMQLSRCNMTDQNFSKFLQALPCLSSLEITDLPNITSLPASETHRFSTMLTELSIRSCQLFQSLSSLQFLGSLKNLVIERCPKVTATSFPLNFRSLSSLKVLRISHCSELQSLSDCGLPSSLETLHIIGCHQEFSKQLRNRKGHYFEKLAVVPNVWIQ